MILRLWRGYHSPELKSLLELSWKNEDLMVLCPPNLSDFDFLKYLPKGELICVGEWPEDLRAQVAKVERSVNAPDFPQKPLLGVFTSGTLSGSPQMVLYSKTNIVSSIEAVLSVFDRDRIQLIFCYPQAFHTFGLVLGYMMAIYLGVELKSFFGKYSKDAHAIRAEMSEENLLTIGTPTHFYDLIEFVKLRRMNIRKSYSTIVGGAIVSRDLYQGINEILNIEAPTIGYGCTEASPAITHTRPGQKILADGDIGHPLSNLISKVESGGVSISGSSLCLAMINQHGVSFPERLLISDQIEVLENGDWRFKGRHDWVINRGGVKFSPEVIETVVRTHLDLASICIARNDQRLGQDIAILVSTDRPVDRCILDIQNLFEREFSVRLHPQQIIFEKNLPLNNSGKIDRAAAKSRVEQSVIE